MDRVFEESITYCLPVPSAAGDVERGEGKGEEGGGRGGMSEAEMVSGVCVCSNLSPF